MIWIYANLSIDQDEKIESMCSECKEEIKKKTCSRCGKTIEEEKEFEVNKNFDEEKFKTLLEE
ncbi:hypothetical protein FQB35_10435 [Crassaminicella thermophila]|uniref:Uncharacterized protein n=1 Tax=Crassaminicella thermophila TaxID=2599308 RepID=A0A5C0SDS4_CRATE|nr:hypothetical protein [Crassaminicella thermophila]QEK12715.1 hypothetical protein FQB35_10435 [Crassaminicella thermophila]